MRRNEALTLVAVLTAVVMFPITLTGASIALPDIRAAFGGDLAAAQWVVNGYNTTFAGFMLASGALADIVGRRRLFAAGTALFAAGGLLSAVAPSLLLLDVLRAISGMGASAAGTSAVAILSASFTGAARTRAFGLFGTTIGFGLAFGPSLSSVLVTSLGWQSVFWLPAAVGLVALGLTPLVPESREGAGRRVDWAGTVTFTGGLLLVIAGFVEGPSLGWSSPVVVAAFAGGALLLVAFALVERRVAEPMFDLDLLRSRRFTAAAMAGAVLVMVLVPLVVYLPSYLTAVLGQSTREAGATLLLLTAPILLLPLLTGVAARRVPENALVLAALVLTGLGVVWLTGIDAGSTAAGLAGPLVTIGVGVGMSTGLVDAVALGGVAPDRSGTASGMFGTSRLAFETVAIGVVGSVLASGTGGALAGPGYTGALRVSLWGLAVVVAAVAVAFALASRRPVPRSLAAAPGVD